MRDVARRRAICRRVGRSRTRERANARAHARIRRAGRSRYQTNGRAAPALITARRRRSYFTPRSSIIHAVNNAPLFRVTLYARSPSLPFLLSRPSSRPSPRVAAEGLPKVSPPTTRDRGACCIRSGHSYLQVYPAKRRHAVSRSLARSPHAVSPGRPVYVSWNSRGNRDDDEGIVSHPSPVDHY